MALSLRINALPSHQGAKRDRNFLENCVLPS